MTIDGETFDPFSAETLKVLSGARASHKDRIVAHSRKKYAIPVGEVKKMLKEEEEAILFRRQAAAASAGKPKEAAESAESNDAPPAPMV